MNQNILPLIEIGYEEQENPADKAPRLCGRLLCPPTLRLTPGQYLQATAPDTQDPRAVTLFAAGPIGSDGSLALAAPLPAHWNAGMRLKIRGPLGKGFHLPAGARQVALATLDESPARLLPLAYQALEQGASVVLCASHFSAGLPSEIEYHSLDQLAELFLWVDYLALDVPLAQVKSLSALLGTRPGLGWGGQRSLFAAEALVWTPMPCGGMGSCGACAVSTRSGWKMACEDGPVFNLAELIEEGG